MPCSTSTLGDELTRGQALRFAALFHDIGKPATRDVLPDGRVTFIGHDSVGEQRDRDDLPPAARRARRCASTWAGSPATTCGSASWCTSAPLSRAAVYRYLTATEPVEIETTLLTCADRLATRGRNAEAAIEAHLDLAREMMAEALDFREQRQAEAARPRRRPGARGSGIEGGPELGELIERLREAAFTGEATTPEQAIALARRLRQNPAR